MRPRVEEILEEVRARLDAAGFDHLPSQRIVLTGGGKPDPRPRRLASRILGNQVRLGRPAARAGPAAIDLRAGLFGLRRSRAFRGLSAGRVVGFRDARRPSARAQPEAGRQMVP